MSGEGTSADGGGATSGRGGLGRLPWARLGAEMVVIVFSVLLALVLDDRRQAREEDRLVESVSLGLLNEFHLNQTTLEERLPYHRAMLDTFTAFGERLSRRTSGDLRRIGGDVVVPMLREIGFTNGLHTSGGFARSAWETAVTSGAANHMDHSLTFVLSTTYASQGEMVTAQERLLEALSHYHLAAIEGERPVFAVVTFLGALQGLVLREDELCDWYVIAARQLGGDDPSEMGECGSGRVRVR